MARKVARAEGGGTVAIVPARGGSKGVPRKNLRMLRGRPLIHYSIKAGLEARTIDSVIVSTEDAEIARAAMRSGAEVVDRPPELATDASPTIEAVLHAIGVLEARGRGPAVIVLLQPTSPLRLAGDIDSAVRLFRRGGCDSVVSVCPMAHPPHWALRLDHGFLAPAFDPVLLTRRRQDLPETYAPNGAVYVSSPGALRDHNGFLAPRTRAYVMPPERSLDIDTELDLELAGFLLRRRGGR